jgi:hypothetical protein
VGELVTVPAPEPVRLTVICLVGMYVRRCTSSKVCDMQEKVVAGPVDDA